jgi:DNA-binding response OmpR family regulator
VRLLLVEDSERLRQLLDESLREALYPLDVVGSAADFRAAIRSVNFDLFIIDLGLPDADGLELIRELRGSGCKTPILVITARAAVDERIAALDGGADDYLIKPFHHAELLARVRALLRRPRELRDPTTQIGGLMFNEVTSEVRLDDQSLELRPSERRLLFLLMRRAGSIVPKAAIEEALSDFSREMSANAVEAVVSRLRKALDDQRTGVVIETIRGIGYALKEIAK